MRRTAAPGAMLTLAPHDAEASDIRQKFLTFFKSKGHTVVRSSPLMSGNDPTLLFINSGMVQFKDAFLGTNRRLYVRVASVQRCLRTDGRRNDPENIGYTTRRHTFFEMFGSRSFGDYFKHDALMWVWELLTQGYKLPAERLRAVVYQTDDETYDIWTKIVGLPSGRVVRVDDNKGAPYTSSNFWQMAETGPCGPCSEIFYDHGPDVWGGPPGGPEADGGRYIEIWDNAFMQFDHQLDPATGEYTLTPLPAPCVDTGTGMECLAAILQHVRSNYETDLFQALAAAATRETNTRNLANNLLRVITDHTRAYPFSIVDNVVSGNEGCSYVLRQITRRAIRYGYKLGCRAVSFHKLVDDLVVQMDEAYPELREAHDRVVGVLHMEEARFFETIEHGMSVLDAALGELETSGTRTLDGKLVFKLHDVYGFPLDLTQDVCRENDMIVDETALDVAITRQREQACAAGKLKMAAGTLGYTGDKTTLHGYEQLMRETAHVTALFVDGVSVQEMYPGRAGMVMLDRTPFYVEPGGQVGDQGTLEAATVWPDVVGMSKVRSDVFDHHGELRIGVLKASDVMVTKVDTVRRVHTMRNHSTTHLAHKALREVLGSHMQQKGSLVDAEKTRFDFSHNALMAPLQTREVETRVNTEVFASAVTSAQLMGFDNAAKNGAVALFGEKYGDEMRVLLIGSSKELYGGAHVARTGDISLLKIMSESGAAAGIRHVEVTTNDNVLHYLQTLGTRINEAVVMLRMQSSELTSHIVQVQDQIETLEEELERLKSKLAASQDNEPASQAVGVVGIKVLATRLDNTDAGTLRKTMGKLKDKLQTVTIMLGSVTDGKVTPIAGVTADTTAKVKAGELVNSIAQQVGGKGGSRPGVAQAGGTEPGDPLQALAGVAARVQQRI